MGRIRQRDTDAEMAVRALLWSMGARYRVNDRSLPGSPDISNKKRRKAIFVHGCFWHFHEGCRAATVPKRNRKFWTDKLTANRERDARKLEQLQALGFDVLTVWRCELAEEGVRRKLRAFWFR